MRVSALASAIREDLITAEGVRRVVLSRRTSAIYSMGTPASHVYFLDSGLVKLERISDVSREILVTVIAGGDIFGEQAITGEGVFTSSARVLESGVGYSIPSDVFQRFCERRPDVWRLVVQHLLKRTEELERKIEHLCHSDVRERLVYYLSELAGLATSHDPQGNIIHISQNELASLVGATRETTSTTLNALARRGLITLGHRLVMIPSLDMLREAGGVGKAARSTAAGTPQM
ncbi:MAG: Crp/Fnr family transcriptional regulator [Bryobacteraceae bacterium]|nr:Crp/Fnr family transcriptional regulator [Bryobacteraceae bacterium]